MYVNKTLIHVLMVTASIILTVTSSSINENTDLVKNPTKILDAVPAASGTKWWHLGALSSLYKKQENEKQEVGNKAPAVSENIAPMDVSLEETSVNLDSTMPKPKTKCNDACSNYWTTQVTDKMSAFTGVCFLATKASQGMLDQFSGAAAVLSSAVQTAGEKCSNAVMAALKLSPLNCLKLDNYPFLMDTFGSISSYVKKLQSDLNPLQFNARPNGHYFMGIAFGGSPDENRTDLFSEFGFVFRGTNDGVEVQGEVRSKIKKLFISSNSESIDEKTFLDDSGRSWVKFGTPWYKISNVALLPNIKMPLYIPGLPLLGYVSISFSNVKVTTKETRFKADLSVNYCIVPLVGIEVMDIKFTHNPFQLVGNPALNLKFTGSWSYLLDTLTKFIKAGFRMFFTNNELPTIKDMLDSVTSSLEAIKDPKNALKTESGSNWVMVYLPFAGEKDMSKKDFYTEIGFKVEVEGSGGLKQVLLTMFCRSKTFDYANQLQRKETNPNIEEYLTMVESEHVVLYTGKEIHPIMMDIKLPMVPDKGKTITEIIVSGYENDILKISLTISVNYSGFNLFIIKITDIDLNLEKIRIESTGTVKLEKSHQLQRLQSVVGGLQRKQSIRDN